MHYIHVDVSVQFARLQHNGLFRGRNFQRSESGYFTTLWVNNRLNHHHHSEFDIHEFGGACESSHILHLLVVRSQRWSYRVRQLSVFFER